MPKRWVLTDEQKAELTKAAKTDPRPYVRIRALAVLQVANGIPAIKVAEFALAHRTTVCTWVKDFQSEGVKGFVVAEGRGRKSAVTSEELANYLRQSPRVFGVPRTRWSLTTLAQVVPCLKGMSPPGVMNALERHGFSYKRGQPHLHSPDPDYEKKKEAVDEALTLTRANPEKCVLLYEDEASFYRQPTQASLYSPKGREQPHLPYACGSNTVMRVAGFLDAISGALHAWDASKITASKLAKCFKEILERYEKAETIYVVMDNWPVHFHSTILKVVEQNPKLNILKLPTYAPWLNPIEKVWRMTKQTVVHAHPMSGNFLQFKETVRQTLAKPTEDPSDLLRYVGLIPK